MPSFANEHEIRKSQLYAKGRQRPAPIDMTIIIQHAQYAMTHKA